MWSTSWPRRGWWRIWGIRPRSRRCGVRRGAKTDRADARLLRTLLLEGRFPESWVPPAHVVEVRTLGRLYCTLID